VNDDYLTTVYNRKPSRAEGACILANIAMATRYIALPRAQLNLASYSRSDVN